MAENSKIEWTDATWNPLVVRDQDGKVGFHCEKVSEECTHCYAETFNGRKLPARGTGLPYKRSSLDVLTPKVHEETLLKPLSWKRPRKVFVCSMTDIFGDWWSDAMIDRVFAVMALCPQHTFQVLTKRPERMAKYFEGETEVEDSDGDRVMFSRRRMIELRMNGLLHAGAGGRRINGVYAASGAVGGGDQWPLKNVWLGVTAGTQKAADERIPHLLRVPAAVRFLSVEPLLGPMVLDQRLLDPIKGTSQHGQRFIDWIIVGGESGPGARPCNVEWVRSIRDQCQAAGVPFFFKQWGQFVPNDLDCLPDGFAAMRDHYKLRPTDGLYSVGKKAAGRLLDGREWNEMPTT